MYQHITITIEQILIYMLLEIVKVFTSLDMPLSQNRYKIIRGIQMAAKAAMPQPIPTAQVGNLQSGFVGLLQSSSEQLTTLMIKTHWKHKVISIYIQGDRGKRNEKIDYMVTRCSKLPVAICINQFKETATDILLIIH